MAPTSSGMTLPVTQPVTAPVVKDVHGVVNMNGSASGQEVDLTAQEIISKYRKASIRSQFPEEFLDYTLKEIEKLTKLSGEMGRKAKTAYKLLKDGRFRK